MTDWTTQQIAERDVARQLAEYAILRGWSFQVETVASEQFEEKEWVFSFPAHLADEPERYLEKLRMEMSETRDPSDG